MKFSLGKYFKMAVIGISTYKGYNYIEDRLIKSKQRVKRAQLAGKKNTSTSIPSQVKDSSHDIDTILSKAETISLTPKEKDNLRVIGAQLVGEAGSIVQDIHHFNGLLQVNVPIDKLAQVKGNPNLLRGFVLKDGKVIEQAQFKPVNSLDIASPIIIRQTLVVAANMYMQEQLMQKLEEIQKGVDRINSRLINYDLGIILNGFHELQNLSKQDGFSENDIKRVEDLIHELGNLCYNFPGIIQEEKEKLFGDFGLWQNVLVDAEKALNNCKYILKILSIALMSEYVYRAANFMLYNILCRSAQRDNGKVNNALTDFKDNKRTEIYITAFNNVRNEILEFIGSCVKDASLLKGKVKEIYIESKKMFTETEKVFNQIEDRINNTPLLFIKYTNGEPELLKVEL